VLRSKPWGVLPRSTLSPASESPRRWAADTNQASQRFWSEAAAAAVIHEEQPQRLALVNGRAAMVGGLTGVITKALSGPGTLTQVGLGTQLSQG